MEIYEIAKIAAGPTEVHMSLGGDAIALLLSCLAFFHGIKTSVAHQMVIKG